MQSIGDALAAEIGKLAQPAQPEPEVVPEKPGQVKAEPAKEPAPAPEEALRRQGQHRSKEIGDTWTLSKSRILSVRVTSLPTISRRSST